MIDMPREWKMRPRPRKSPIPSDASPEMIAAVNEAYERALEEDARNESALLAEAIGEISKIVLSFDDESRHQLAQMFAVLGPEPEDDKPDPWLETLEGIKHVAIAYTAAAQENAKRGCPDCAKRKPAPDAPRTTETTVTRDERGLVVHLSDGRIVRVPWVTLAQLDLEDVAPETETPSPDDGKPA